MKNFKRILIVEDELVIADNTKFMIEELYNELKVEIAGSSEEALTKLDEEQTDLVLLDIRLGKNDNGIVFAEELVKRSIPFIFLTAHGDDRTVSEALQKEPIGYLIKPISQQDLNVNLKLAEKKLSTNKYYTFRDGSHDVRLLEKEIVYLEVDGNYTEIHTIDKRYVVRKSMTKVLEELDMPFVQVHRKCFVNPVFVKEANSSVYLSTGEVLPLSRTYKKNLLEQLFT